MITNPAGKFYALVKICTQMLDEDLAQLESDRIRLAEYRQSKPGNVMQIQAWQEKLDKRLQHIETMREAITEHFPALLEAEGKRRFFKGREAERSDKAPRSWFKSENEKEAARHYSIARQRLIDNV